MSDPNGFSTTSAEVIDGELVIVETEKDVSDDIESIEWSMTIADIDDDAVITVTEGDIIEEIVLPA